MAVYTHVPAEEMAVLLLRYNAGTLRSAKGIAEGVQNSNFLVEAEHGRFILTLYEEGRVEESELPFFLALVDHLANAGLPVPRALRDRHGVQIQTVSGRPACLIEFLDGVSLSHPNVAQARATGEALGRMHAALTDFESERHNDLGINGWRPLSERCGDVDSIAPGLTRRIADELDFLDAHWPAHLPRAVVHADLFPDNVLMLGDAVTGLIDFYFACTDVRAYDLAVTHSAWAFEADGTTYNAEIGDALVSGYEASFGLSNAERAALPVLARGSALRFTLTRAWDWLNTPPDALVTRKDPLAYLHRLDAYAANGAAMFGA